MSKINLLSEEVVSKIAAGEVIDAPYSVVRELIDNSIDAGSSRIVVNVYEGGKKLIEVIDDGEGMDEEDLKKCYLRHTTSKIKLIDDIYKIRTMGFRGEALGSIAEVSELEIISKTKGNIEGCKIIVKSGKIILSTPTPSKDGTTVRVKELFFNLPARRNFLKSDTTEFKNIYDVFIKKAIPLPQIHFELYHNGKKELILPKSESKLERIKTVYPEIKELNEIKKEFEGGIKLEIYFSKPHIIKPSRNNQQLFVNNRFVESKTFYTAVSNAYSNLVAKGSFPIVFCFIEIDPSMVDVNIHPAKKEIKFLNEGKIFHYIMTSIKEGLSSLDQTIYIDEPLYFNKFEMEIKKSIQSFLSRDGNKKDFSEYRQKNLSSIPSQEEESKKQLQQELKLKETQINYREMENEIIQNNKNYKEIPNYPEKLKNIKFIGTALGTFLIFEDIENERVIIVDQHAAHERIIFSELYNEYQTKNNLEKQLILTSTKYKISRNYLNILKENYKVFSKLGFELEFEENEIEIKSIPSFFDKTFNPIDIIVEVCERINEGMEINPEKIIEILATISCRKAIKSGDNLTKEEALKLIQTLFSIELRYSCPHGRPTTIYIDRKTFEKLFFRT
ncbi:MAG: DNA mismatch repair endonuclease MutL [Brevinematia bacterium]